MSALTNGESAPAIELGVLNGGNFSLATARQRGPVVATFFKGSCPVCQFALPYINRIYKNYPQEKVTVVAVSQDDTGQTRDFAQRYDLDLPMVLEDTTSYAVSNAYGLTNVPTTFAIGTNGEIKLSSVGWSQDEIEHLNSLVAAAAGVPPKPVFHPGEDIPAFKAG